MFPTILLLYPNYAEKLLKYRLDTAYVAAELAKMSGNKGYRLVLIYDMHSSYITNK